MDSVRKIKLIVSNTSQSTSKMKDAPNVKMDSTSTETMNVNQSNQDVFTKTEDAFHATSPSSKTPATKEDASFQVANNTISKDVPSVDTPISKKTTSV